MNFLIKWSPLLLSLAIPTTLFADTGTRCDCSLDKRKGSCESTIGITGNWITITSNSNQCSMVVWNSDGQPDVTIVTDGRETEEWLGQGTPSLQVDSCQVCADRMFSESTINGNEDNDSVADENPQGKPCQCVSEAHGGGVVDYRTCKQILTETVGENGVFRHWADTNGDTYYNGTSIECFKSCAPQCY